MKIFKKAKFKAKKTMSLLLVFCMVITMMPFTSTEVQASSWTPVVTIHNFEIGKKVEDLTFTVNISYYYAELLYVWDFDTDAYANDSDVFKKQGYFVGVRLKNKSDDSTKYKGEFKVVYRGAYGDKTYTTSNLSGKGAPMPPPYSPSNFKGFVDCKFTTKNYEVGKKVSDVTLDSADPSKYTAQNLVIGEIYDSSGKAIPLSGDAVFEPGERYYFSFDHVLENGYEPKGYFDDDGNIQYNLTIDGREKLRYYRHVTCKLYYGDLEGIATITGTAQVGETLTATVVGANADESTFTYQWYRTNLYNPISGETGKTYTILPEDLYDTFLVRIKSTHKNGNDGIISAETKAVIAAEKADGPTAPNEPVLKAVNNERIEVEVVAGQEFSIDNGANWRDVGTFMGLTANTEYSIVTRIKETETTKSSAPSLPLTVKTTSQSTASYPLIVENGSGDGIYAANEYANITADKITGKEFVNWTSNNGGAFDDENSETTRFNLTANSATTITANYIDVVTAVTSVEVTPNTCTKKQGENQMFIATVLGTGSPSQTVTWEVLNATSADTKIAENGVLTVAVDETSTNLMVKATSTFDTSKSATATVTVEVIPNVIPDVIEGNNQTIKVGTNKDVVFKFDGDINYLNELKLNGIDLDYPNDFTVESGSVIITLKGDYVKTLPVGTHSFMVGLGNARFPMNLIVENVKKPDSTPSPEPETPDTGDSNAMWLYLALALVSIGGVGFVVLKRRMAR